ncbi:hypothetical protein E2562_037470 [Oryza meyeriana var. granulata]|uniref:Uncharacterized protein n=1 Tax=Oryza meyeriana var. granulata TaxID=110450 RepID=A0A6G1DT72_9ORYZ|nr:hypothetical protein E2562_037470 [Oryza meyeriana var. granulata]
MPPPCHTQGCTHITVAAWLSLPCHLKCSHRQTPRSQIKGTARSTLRRLCGHLEIGCMSEVNVKTELPVILGTDRLIYSTTTSTSSTSSVFGGDHRIGAANSS